jgi:UDP-2,3-diacylglucosamine pyrophosphatase LpxH
MQFAKDNNAFPIMTGDIIDVPSVANTDFLSSLVNKDNTFYVLGNHDWSFLDYHYRRNVFDTKENDSRCKAYYDKYYPYFHTLVSDGDAYCQKIEYDDLILVGIDNGDREFTEKHLEYLKEQSKKNKPILLCFHVPIYTDELAIPTTKVWRHANSLVGGPNNIDKAKTKEFIDFITSEDSNVFAILCGDVHFSHESKIKGVLPQYVVGGAYANEVRLITLTPEE